MRYLIGIDLGTTNSALAYVDLEKVHFPIQLFPVPQLTALGKVDSLSTLPSFCYLAAQGEWPSGALKLPWKEETIHFAGKLAKMEGARIPTRLVQSAKSWLCNVAANRRDKILPLEAADINHRMSPVEASAKYLIHLRDAWNHSMAKNNPAAVLEEQEIILTVPASFDEIARNLTVEAAKMAGFRHLTLLEEPQAAFYNWISRHENEWMNKFKEGDRILVCDVGGGTTDFTLIEIRGQESKLTFHRMAVGDHLLLGGDNMDAALAHLIEKKMTASGQSLESFQWLQLLAEARNAKEELLNPQTHGTYSIFIQGTGSSVIKGSINAEINTSEVEELLLEGFFGTYSLLEAQTMLKSRGIRSMGLPYEDEPSITKHLAYFLRHSHGFEVGKEGVDYVLFNGGTFKPPSFQAAILQSLKSWFPEKTPVILPSESLDLAVAKGAAYYGKVRRGMGVAIEGGLPRTYYLELEVKDSSEKTVHKALTLLVRGTQEGYVYKSLQTFNLRANTPVAFNLLTSNVRLDDAEGSLQEIDEQEMQRLPPIQTILKVGRKSNEAGHQEMPVKIGIKLTPVGTIEIWLESLQTEHRWNLEFQLRSALGQDNHIQVLEKVQNDLTFDVSFLEDAKKTLASCFSRAGDVKPGQLMEKLESELNMPRRDWPPSVLRGLWASLLKIQENKKISADHEARWWNLAGFLLRPGFGFPLDDFRVKELWKIVLGELKAAKVPEVWLQMLICFRRVAGGFNKGQQMQIAGELTSEFFEKNKAKIDVRKKGELYSYSEKIRTLAAMERLDLPLKIRLGDRLVSRILHEKGMDCEYWALGRIGARQLFYGSAGQVVPKEICVKWMKQLLEVDMSGEGLFMLGQMARKTDHRELNLPAEIVDQLLKKYPDSAIERWVLEEKSLSDSEREHVFGEKLPVGLVLNE